MIRLLEYDALDFIKVLTFEARSVLKRDVLGYFDEFSLYLSNSRDWFEPKLYVLRLVHPLERGYFESDLLVGHFEKVDFIKVVLF